MANGAGCVHGGVSSVGGIGGICGVGGRYIYGQHGGGGDNVCSGPLGVDGAQDGHDCAVLRHVHNSDVCTGPFHEHALAEMY